MSLMNLLTYETLLFHTDRSRRKLFRDERVLIDD